jgi:orotidine-5'-phosphate decarboxylase
MTRSDLVRAIRARNSFLCVGIDPVLNKIPSRLKESGDPLVEFGKYIIETTQDLCVAYKFNSAFYEAHGSSGWHALESTIAMVPEGHFIILDAKRGDIGNSSGQYAIAAFEHLGADALTVSPYMGRDSVEPFLGFPGKWAIVLAVTSNEGSADFQMQQVGNWKLYEEVLIRASAWGTEENMMFVVGAQHAELLAGIRDIVPDHFLLIPGVGTQGGDIKAVCNAAMTAECGLLVNISRAIIYADDVRKAARHYQELMAEELAIRA